MEHWHTDSLQILALAEEQRLVGRAQMYLMVLRVQVRLRVVLRFVRGSENLGRGIGGRVSLRYFRHGWLVLYYEATYFTGIRFDPYPFRWSGTIRALVIYPT